MLAAQSEHSDNLIQRWVEPRSSCRAYAHLPDITTSTSFQRISGMLKSTNFASQEQTSDCYSKPVVQIESQALSVNLPMLHRDIEFWKKDCFVIMSMNLPVLTLEKNWINQRSCCTRPGVETGSRITLPLELNDSTLSSSCLKAVSPLSMLDTA